MGGTCSTPESYGKMHIKLELEIVEEISHSKYLDLKKIAWECVGCIHLAQDRDRWRALVNTTVINLRIS
jgi:hypothetical protein